jgi:hypothetical protein
MGHGDIGSLLGANTVGEGTKGNLLESPGSRAGGGLNTSNDGNGLTKIATNMSQSSRPSFRRKPESILFASAQKRRTWMPACAGMTILDSQSLS